MVIVTQPVFSTGHPRSFFPGPHPSLNFSACLPQPVLVLPLSVLLPPQLSFLSSWTWSFLNFEPLLTTLTLLAPSTASVSFPSHICSPHLTVSLCLPVLPVPFLVLTSSSLLAFSSISSPGPPASPHFPLCLPMPGFLHLAASFAASSTTFSSQHSLCL